MCAGSSTVESAPPTSGRRAADSATPVLRTTRERVLAYDILRVFAAATVVSIHVFAAYIATAGPLALLDPVNVFDQGLHYAVPLFTFLSGALSWGAVWGGGSGRYLRFLQKRWMAVGLPYVAWAALFYFLRPFFGYPPLADGVLGKVREFLMLTISGTGWYHLYFMPMILVLYLLTPLASRAVHKAPELFLGGFLFFVLYITPLVMARYHGMAIHRTLDPWIGALVGNLITYSPFMALGAWYSVRQDRIAQILPRLSAPLLLFAVVLTVVNLAYPAPGGVLNLPSWAYIVDMSAFVLGLLGAAHVLAERPVLTRDAKWADRLVVLASLTLGVYLVHPLVITFGGRKLADAVGLLWLWHSLAFAVAFDAVAVALAFAIVWVLKRWRVTAKFV